MRKTIEEVRSYFSEQGCTLLSDEYKNNKGKLSYVCSCGNRSEISFNNFNKGSRCKVCGIRKTKDMQKKSYEQVKKDIEKHGFKLISTEYENWNTPLFYICTCGKESKGYYQRLSIGSGCQKCGIEKTKHNKEYIKGYFKNRGCEWVGGEYENVNSKLTYQCNCGNVTKITFHGFQKGQRCLKCAIKNYKKNYSGKNHPCYNKEITDVEREEKRKFKRYVEWRTEVYERDNYKCRCCGYTGSGLNAHHLESYLSNKYLRTTLSNGVTLCGKCHKEFHKKFGYRNNDAIQFSLFMEAKGKYFEIKSQQLSIL